MVVTFDESTAMDYVQKNNLVFHTYTLPINCEQFIRDSNMLAGCWLLAAIIKTCYAAL